MPACHAFSPWPLEISEEWQQFHVHTVGVCLKCCHKLERPLSWELLSGVEGPSPLYRAPVIFQRKTATSHTMRRNINLPPHPTVPPYPKPGSVSNRTLYDVRKAFSLNHMLFLQSGALGHFASFSSAILLGEFHIKWTLQPNCSARFGAPVVIWGYFRGAWDINVYYIMLIT